MQNIELIFQKPRQTHMKIEPLFPTILALSVLAGSAAFQLAFANGADIDTNRSELTGDFTPSSLESDWDERSFRKNTEYKIVDLDGAKVLHGYTNGTASILYREEAISLKDTPQITWSWKIDRTFPNDKEKVRSGDDFPARVYVAAQIGFLPWETLAITYVWASEIPKDETWINPFTEKGIMVALQSGDEFVGQWMMQSRNLAEDFKNLHDIDLDEISAYAVMIDGDNTNVEGNAWFGNIKFSAALE